MASEDTYVKVNAIHRLPIVATLMGPNAVTNELVPFLKSKA